MLIPALLGGLFVGVLSALPFVNVANCCCVWIFSGGLLAAHVLQQNDSQPIGFQQGAMVGFGAGAIGAFVWLVLTMVMEPFLLPMQQQMVAAFARNAGDLPPQLREALDSMSEPGPAATRWAFGFFTQFFAGAIFSTLGGIVGSNIFRPSPPPIVPPPLPPLS